MRNRGTENVMESNTHCPRTAASLAPGLVRLHIMRPGVTPDITSKNLETREQPMHLRKAIVLGAAAATAGLLALIPAVQATTITGGNITTIQIGGSVVAGADTVSGIFKSGTATFDSLGFTATCSGGTVGGVMNRGPLTSGGNVFTFTALNLTCATPLGINAIISTNCIVAVTMGGVRPTHDNVHTGLTDTGAYTGIMQKNHNVLGSLTLPGGNCIKVQLSVGGCIAYASGTTGVQFNEAQKTVGGVTYQDIILNGTSSVSLYGQNGSCLGIMQGTVSLNNIDFNIKTGTGGAIDFRP
jgi:hypothetical protein